MLWLGDDSIFAMQKNMVLALAFMVLHNKSTKCQIYKFFVLKRKRIQILVKLKKSRY